MRKSGPDLEPLITRYGSIALSGQISVPVFARNNLTPLRNGSVFDCLICHLGVWPPF